MSRASRIEERGIKF